MKNLGFTLMEIAVTVGIMSVLTSVSWVAFSALWPSLKLSGAARDIASDLRYAQQLSVAQQVNHGIMFSTSTEEYALFWFGTSTEELSRKKLPSGIVFCSFVGLTDNVAVFNSYGGVLDAGSVCLSNDKAQNRIIEIKPSGFVKIQR